MNYQQKDAILYQKAKTRTSIRLFFSYIFLVLYFVGSFFLLNLDFLDNPLPPLFLIILAGGQLVLYLILFLMLVSGAKVFRIFYWICFFFEFLLVALPVYYLIQDIPSFMFYAAWIGCMLIKLIFLYAVGHSLGHNRWSKILYDHVVEIDEESEEEEYGEYDQEEELYEPIKKPVYPKYEYEEKDYEAEPYTLPQVSVRLGICIYASLMVFPIVVQIFSNFFVSNDLQTVFATKDIFILSIITAVIWTIPIFFMYYNHPYSKRILIGCAIGEIISLAAYMPKFIGYITSGAYPIRVFILFAIVELVRYAILLWALRPLTKT